MDLLEGIKGNKFVVFGRAGMDMFADPVGTKSELQTLLSLIWEVRLQTYVLDYVSWDHRLLSSLLFPMML